MRNRLRYTLLVIGASGIFACTQAPAPAPADAVTADAAPTDELSRTPDGRPRLDGIWQALTEANYDIRPHAAGPAPLLEMGTFSAIRPGLGIVDGGELPYQDWAVEQQQANFADRLELDPEGKCFLPGVPRATYLPYPFQILQTPDFVMIAYQYANAVRTVHMNDPGPAPADSWMGWSVGRWEGDTLVVDVTSQNDQTWFDRAGNFHSNAIHVVERYTPQGPNHLLYEATIDDPEVFTRPWQISLPLYRRVEDNVELMEFKCVEFVEEKIYGHLRKQAEE